MSLLCCAANDEYQHQLLPVDWRPLHFEEVEKDAVVDNITDDIFDDDECDEES